MGFSYFNPNADLYTIRNQMQDGQGGSRFVGYYSADPATATEEPKTVGEYGDSEFLLAVAGKDPAKAWTVVDELMDTFWMGSFFMPADGSP